MVDMGRKRGSKRVEPRRAGSGFKAQCRGTTSRYYETKNHDRACKCFHFVTLKGDHLAHAVPYRTGGIEKSTSFDGGRRRESRGVNTMTVFSSGRGVHPPVQHAARARQASAVSGHRTANLRERDRYKLALANC